MFVLAFSVCGSVSVFLCVRFTDCIVCCWLAVLCVSVFVNVFD